MASVAEVTADLACVLSTQEHNDADDVSFCTEAAVVGPASVAFLSGRGRSCRAVLYEGYLTMQYSFVIGLIENFFFAPVFRITST